MTEGARLGAFNSGTRLACALAIITAADPLASITCGVVWLHEQITTIAPALACEIVSLAVMTAGVIAWPPRWSGSTAGASPTKTRASSLRTGLDESAAPEVKSSDPRTG